MPKAMAVDLQQPTSKSMLTELRQLVLAGCEAEMYEEALEALLDEAMSENISAHEDEMLLKRATRSLVAAKKAWQAAVTAEESITEEGESKDQAKAEAEAKVTILDSEKTKWKNMCVYSRR